MKIKLMAMVLAGAVLTLVPATAYSQPPTTGGAQAATPVVVEATSFGYARLGYGGLLGDRTYGMPSFGLGYRAELKKLGLDISFLNIQTSSDGIESTELAGAWIKLEALYYTRPEAAKSVYAGGGLSLGSVSFGEDSVERNPDGSYDFVAPYERSGLQGELTVGYEVARHSTLRIFVQADGTLPLYSAVSVTTISSRALTTTTTRTDHRYAPSVTFSIGMGWGKGRH